MLAPLAQEFGLSEQDVAELLPSGRTNVLASRAHWARTYMAKAGLVRSVRRGVFEATDAGRAMLDGRPARIDNKTLSMNPEFVTWRLKSSANDGPEQGPEVLKPIHIPQKTSPETTPEEAIQIAFDELESALAEDILGLLLERPPAFFEHVVVALLKAMGYGRGREDAGKLLGKPGDGGIDGVINEDALGLDAVYIQAKRYAAGNTVGRPAIQQFIGSMTGEGATKGVFVTTSDFSTEAKSYLARVQQRVVLINGQQLARLMIDHEIGVRARKLYTIRSIDEDFFAEE